MVKLETFDRDLLIKALYMGRKTKMAAVSGKMETEERRNHLANGEALVSGMADLIVAVAMLGIEDLDERREYLDKLVWEHWPVYAKYEAMDSVENGVGHTVDMSLVPILKTPSRNWKKIMEGAFDYQVPKEETERVVNGEFPIIAPLTTDLVIALVIKQWADMESHRQLHIYGAAVDRESGFVVLPKTETVNNDFINLAEVIIFLEGSLGLKPMGMPEGKTARALANAVSLAFPGRKILDASVISDPFREGKPNRKEGSRVSWVDI